MLKQFTGLTVYECEKIQDLDANLVEQADLVIVHEHVQGGIYGPYKMFWVGLLPESDDPFCLIHSAREKKGLVKSQEYLQQNGFTIETIPATPELFFEFKQLYEATTGTKERFQKLDLDERILSKIKGGVPTFLSVIKEGARIHSALVFYIQANQVFVTVGAKQRMDALRGGTGGVLEIELVRFCIEYKIKTVFHGKNRNPIGLFNKLGQFTFKTRYGYTAYPQDHWATFFVLNPNSGVSDWLFLSINQDTLSYKILTDPQKSQVSAKEFDSHSGINISIENQDEISKKHRQMLKLHFESK